MKSIIFDFDGVLVNSFPFEHEIGRQFIDEEMTVDEYRALFEGNFYEVFRMRYPELDHEQVMKELYSEYERRIMETPLFVGIRELLESVPLDLPCFIVSSTPSNIIQAYLDKQQLSQRFQGIYGSDIDKSKQRKLQLILERTDLAPSDVIFITDTSGDVKEAREVGIDSIAVTWGFHTSELLTSASPKYLVNSIDGLKDLILNF